MNCDAVDERLLEFVEGELDPDAAREVQSHLDGCELCRGRLAETHELLGAMDEARRLPPAAAADLRAWSRGTRLGDFEILDELGRGGMGIVYRARQMSLNRVVALKVLSTLLGQSSSAVTRFRMEAQAAARLHHTNIVGVFAQGEHEGHLFYAMELITGRSLDRVLRDDPSGVFSDSATTASARPVAFDAPPAPSAMPTLRRRNFRRLARLISEVADGLEHAHREGVVHRDIKPQNLILGDDGHLHITDFGLARLFDEPGVTLSGEMLGTPAYMSPEQVGADRRQIDHRTDIYSLGVTLYELLTGQRPFDGATRAQIIAQITSREPRAPRRIEPAIPIDLETICLRAIEKDPARRYQTTGELAADLRRFAEHMPIVSRRVGPLEKTIKWVRRHPAATTIIALTVVLAGVATASALYWRHSRRISADRFVARAYEMLAYDDYRETAMPLALLADAERLGPDPVRYRIALALATLLHDTPAAIRHLQWAVAQAPDDTDTMYLLAWALRINDRFAEELQWIDRADAAGGPATAAGEFFRGQSVIRHQPDEATHCFQRAIEKRPLYFQAMLHLARALNVRMYHYRTNDRFDDQKRYLVTVCDAQPDKAYPRYLLSIAYRFSAEICEAEGQAREADDRFKAALHYAREARRVEPDSPRGYACEAEYWESRRDYPRAIQAWDDGAEVFRQSRRLGELYEYRWRVCYWAGLLDRALADLHAVVEHCPSEDPKRVWHTALFPALVHAERGDPDTALHLVRSITALDPESQRAATSAACMLRLLGRSDEADALLDHCADEINFRVTIVPHVPPEWLQSTYEFCRGRLTWDQLLDSAGPRRTDKWLLANALFFDAAAALARGDRDTAARRLRECEQSYDDEDYSYLAKTLLRRLESDPLWPPWLPTSARNPR